MQYIQATIYLMLTSCFMMTSVQAHDPSEHVKTNEAPKCESMKAMDHSKMDANDPIMMAMMKKCKAQAQKEAHPANGPQQYGNGPQQYGNGPQQYGNGPQQYGP